MIVAIVAFACAASAADGFCGVIVNISAQSGQPVNSTLIEVLDSTGKVVRSEFTKGPQYRLCDFGFGAHSIRVGANECIPVTISNLKILLHSQLVLDVILNRCSPHMMRNSCFLYFRTVD